MLEAGLPKKLKLCFSLAKDITLNCWAQLYSASIHRLINGVLLDPPEIKHNIHHHVIVFGKRSYFTLLGTVVQCSVNSLVYS